MSISASAFHDFSSGTDRRCGMFTGEKSKMHDNPRTIII